MPPKGPKPPDQSLSDATTKLLERLQRKKDEMEREAKSAAAKKRKGLQSSARAALGVVPSGPSVEPLGGGGESGPRGGEPSNQQGDSGGGAADKRPGIVMSSKTAATVEALTGKKKRGRPKGRRSLPAVAPRREFFFPFRVALLTLVRFFSRSPRSV